MPDCPLNVGIIGGGPDAFFAHVHRRAILSCGMRIVAGVLSGNPQKAMAYARDWPDEGFVGYPDLDTMIKECHRREGPKVDYMVIVTSNHTHFDLAIKCLAAGYPVFLEKPITMTVDEALQLVKHLEMYPKPFAVAHTYLGHWTTLLCRHIVTSGLLGDVRLVKANYLQDWLAHRTEDTDSKQAKWRVDPKQAGMSGCGGDIASHAHMQTRFVTGLELRGILYAKLTSFVPRRQLDDNFTTICCLSNGAEAHINASQVAIGHKNDLSLEVNGTKGSLFWHQEESEKVMVYYSHQPDRVYWRGKVTGNDGFLGNIPAELFAEGRLLPAGHTEGLHDALARLHRYFAKDVRASRIATWRPNIKSCYATVHDGLKGMQFIANAIECSNTGRSVTM